ncbi:MAG: T9SS type A sorting domain-containing protein [Bacteroidales bacterium]|jgi:hypothetical protein|nr:T9SS type A sorting domain-containing protein [Bacteroidales bacterium]
MKKFLLLSFCLFLVTVAHSQKLSENDSVKLVRFLEQEAYSRLGNTTGVLNAHVFRLTDNWKDELRTSPFITCSLDLEGTQSINYINTPDSLNQDGKAYYLSGSLDLSGCTNLQMVGLGKNKLSTAIFNGCINLSNVDMGSNIIQLVDFSGCTNLSSVNLDVNQLTSIDFSENHKLSSASLNSNMLSFINLEGNMSSSLFLMLEGNQLLFSGIKGYSADRVTLAGTQDIRYVIEEVYTENPTIDLSRETLGEVANFNWKDQGTSISVPNDGQGIFFPSLSDYNLDDLECEIQYSSGVLPGFTVRLTFDFFSGNIKVEGAESYQGSYTVFTRTDDGGLIKTNELTGIPKGDCIVRFNPSTGNFFPTYNTSLPTDKQPVEWSVAEIISITEQGETKIAVIDPVPVPTFIPGTGTIKGKISGGYPEGVNVLLYKHPEETPFTYTSVATDGSFQFYNLPEADYLVIVDMPGYEVSLDDRMIITSRPGSVEEIYFIAEEADKTINYYLPTGRMMITLEPGTNNALVEIYHIKGEDIVLVDTAKWDGVFFSGDLPLGNYLVSVDHVDGYLLTYHTNALTWREATIVSLINEDVNVPVSIKLNPLPALGIGNITIEGTIYDASTIKARVALNSTVGIYRSTKSAQKSDDWELVRRVRPDTDGYYRFSNLPEGIYRVVLELPGYTLQGNGIEIDAKSGGIYTANDFMVNEADKTINDIISSVPSFDETKLTVYPNPFVDVVRITGMEGPCTIKIVNILGQTILSETNSLSDMTLDLSNRPSGLYILKIEVKGNTITRKLIKK